MSDRSQTDRQLVDDSQVFDAEAIADAIEILEESPDPLALFADEEEDLAPERPSIVDEDERLRREVAALASTLPTRAALIEAFRARVAIDVRGDLAAAVTACDRADALAPDLR